MQARITDMIKSYNEDQQTSLQELSNSNTINMMDEGYQLYLNASESGNFDAKVKSLSYLAQHFLDLRGSESDIFINPEAFKTQTQTMLQKAGTKLCLGPRNNSGTPTCKKLINCSCSGKKRCL